jgi:hypothetical protein
VIGILAMVLLMPASAEATAARHFPNCTAMHKVYPHGVGKPTARDHTASGQSPVTNFKKSSALYLANKGLDRDHDGIACEAH